MGLKDVILKKGWAGRTISREETIERLNPIVSHMADLLSCYNRIARSREGAAPPEAIETQLKLLRMDIGKMSETIFSAGGTARRHAQSIADADSDSYDALIELEQALASQLVQETEVEHQMRTRAILGAVETNTKERIRVLKRLN